MSKNSTNLKVMIVYYTQKGHTKALAEAVAEGVKKVAGATPQLFQIGESETNWEELRSADAIIFGTPTLMGAVAGKMKQFMDDSVKEWFGQTWKDKVGAAFTHSAHLNGDKLHTLIELAIFAAQHGMHWVNLGLMPSDDQDTSKPENLNRLSSWLGAMAQTQPDATLPPTSDIMTAQALGERVAKVTQELKAGREALQ